MIIIDDFVFVSKTKLNINSGRQKSRSKATKNMKKHDVRISNNNQLKTDAPNANPYSSANESTKSCFP